MEDLKERKKLEAQYWFSFLNNKVSKENFHHSWTSHRIRGNSHPQVIESNSNISLEEENCNFIKVERTLILDAANSEEVPKTEKITNAEGSQSTTKVTSRINTPRLKNNEQQSSFQPKITKPLRLPQLKTTDAQLASNRSIISTKASAHSHVKKLR